MKIQAYILESTVFLCGAVVMVFELVGSRVLGPYFGTSTFVWTSLIGIILGSLSLGYYLGGRAADRRPQYQNLSLIIFLSALGIGLTIALKEPLLMFLQTHIVDIRLASVIGAVLLFSPTSILLGMVSPYAVKLTLGNLNTSGATVGNLYALSTAGSIFGTFLSGFYLIPYFGTNTLLIILSGTLILLSLVLAWGQSFYTKAIMVVIMVLCWVGAEKTNPLLLKQGFLDIDTSYNRVFIYDTEDRQTHRMVKVMGINNENHSSMDLENNELVNEYTKYYHLARHFNSGFRTTLMLGGAGYSYPKAFLETYPEASMDVVEIDPQMTELAKKYFRLTENPRLAIYHEDGRVFLNATPKRYDVIFGDAFGSRYSLPYQLTTKEAVQRKYDVLEEDGVVIVNTISAIKGERGEFLRAEYATYKSIFPQVYLFPVRNREDGLLVQNIMLVALKSKEAPSFTSTDPVLNEYLQHFWRQEIKNDLPILTDDFAPVDFYINKTI